MQHSEPIHKEVDVADTLKCAETAAEGETQTLATVLLGGKTDASRCESLFLSICDCFVEQPERYRGPLHPAQFTLEPDGSVLWTGSNMGDPNLLYASPEEREDAVDGDAPSAASNVYSLALMMLEALTGKSPQNHIFPMGSHQLNLVEVPSEFCSLLARALNPKPSERFQSIAEFRLQLQHRSRIAPRRTPFLIVLIVAALLLTGPFLTSGHQVTDALRAPQPQLSTSSVTPWRYRMSWHSHARDGKKITDIRDRKDNHIIYRYPGPALQTGKVAAAAIKAGISLAGADLRNFDFKGVSELNSGDFRGADLTGACLGCYDRLKITDCDFRGATINNTGIRSYLRNVDFRDTKISNTSFADTELVDCHFERATIDHSDFFFARIRALAFNGTQFATASFNCARIEQCNFSNATLRGVQFQASRLSDCNFQDSLVEKCIFPQFLSNIKYENMTVRDCFGLRRQGERVEHFVPQDPYPFDISETRSLNE